jgi:hypothetical protein
MKSRNRTAVRVATAPRTRRSAPRSASVGPIERLERRQLLTASIGVSTGLMVFNAVNGTASQTETLTLTDVGTNPLTLGPSAFSIAGGSAAQFAVVNGSQAPATLAPGGTFGLHLAYTASTVGRQVAALYIASNDPVNGNLAIGLSGIGTVGLGGTNQPSLTRILRAYGIPTDVGEAESATLYPNPPGASSQEVSLQRLIKAGPGPVSIDVLASFTASGAEPYTLGYYPIGTPTTKNELFYTPSTEYQSTYVQPVGTTSFDPGSTPFGFYFVSNVQVVGRIGYSEDALNTWDTTNDRKVRFFPMETSTGQRVPNTYIMTTTEWNAPIGYDFTNIVAIVSNVTAAPSAPAAPSLTVTNPYALPGSNNVLFNSIYFYNPTIGDTVHNSNTLTLTNTGGSNLVLSSLTLNNSDYSITAAPTLPCTLAAGASTTVTIKLGNGHIPASPYNEDTNPADAASAGGAFDPGTLVIGTNDPVTPSRTITLAGYVQKQSEHEDEPSFQTIVNLLAGYGTLINSTPVSELTESPSAPTYYGEETVSGYWSAADPSRQVTAVQLAAFHTQGDLDALEYTSMGGTSGTLLVSQDSDSGQTLFPKASASYSSPGYFSPTGVFGFKVTGPGGTEYSDDSLNTTTTTGGGHDVRFYAVRDAVGNLVPNTYIMTIDYLQANADFNDNVYVISNIRPASGSGAAPAAPTDLYANNAPGGVQLTWAPSLTAGVTGYNVYRENADGTYTQVNTSLVTTTAYLDTTASLSVANAYRVAAFNGTANTQSVATSTATTFAVPAVALTPTASVSGVTFDDSNGNGVIDTGEVGVAGFGVFIDLFGTGNYVAGVDPYTVSGAGGAWSITGLNPGTYTVVQVAPPGWNRSVPASSTYTVTVDTNQKVTGLNFGASQLGTIAGTIFYDIGGTGTLVAGDPGLAGFTMFIDNNANGVFDPGIDSQFTANAAGQFSITGFAPGTYYVGETVPAGWGRSTPAALNTPVAVHVTELGTATVNFGLTRASISGTVFNDANHNGVKDTGEAGLAGQPVFIDFFGTGVFQAGDIQVITDANGNFTIGGLAPGVYTINRTTPGNYTRTLPTSTLGYTLTVTAGQRLTGENFGLYPTANMVAAMAAVPPATPTTSPFATKAVTPLYDTVDALIG